VGAPDILGLLAERGLTLRPRSDGNLEVSPRRLLTDETRRLILEHKAELLAVLAADVLPDPEAEARHQRLLEMLDSHPTARYALVTDIEADPEAVILALAIRGQATCELRIPREKYDGTLLLDLIERHGATVH